MTTAVRAVLRGPLRLTACLLGSYALAGAVWPQVMARAAPATDPLSAAFASHDCGGRAPDRSLLLIRLRSGEVLLVPDASGGDGGQEQYDWLTEQGAAFFAWCTP